MYILERPENIPHNSKLLQGTGESAWFRIKASNENGIFFITRYSLSGVRECHYKAKLNDIDFKLDDNFEVTYVSHCLKCTVVQNEQTFVFVKIS